MAYMDDVLIRLRRDYERDEVVSALYKKISDLQIENGKLNSEIQHLTHVLSKSKNETQIEILARTELKKQDVFVKTLEKLKAIQKENKNLKRQNSILLNKNIILQQKT